jgi:hypothetical protein
VDQLAVQLKALRLENERLTELIEDRDKAVKKLSAVLAAVRARADDAYRLGYQSGWALEHALLDITEMRRDLDGVLSGDE